MLANSIIRKEAPGGIGAFCGRNTLNKNYMKHLRYLFILLLLVAGSSPKLFAQTPTDISLQQSVYCFGDQVILNISPTIPAGKTPQQYRFYIGPAGGNIYQTVGVNPATNGNPGQYTFFNTPAGEWQVRGSVVFTSGDSVVTGTITSFFVYNLPNALFSLDPSNNDTQCFKGNSFCFLNNSTKGAAPSNDIDKCEWVWGDGNFTQDCNPGPLCHQFGLIKRFDVVLRVTDKLGCKQEIQNPPGVDSGVVVIGTTPPDFKWTQVSGPCFKSCYRFKNLSVATIDKVKAYQWDFGDGTKTLCNTNIEPDSSLYSAFMPFKNSVTHQDSVRMLFDSSYYDTIVHCYCADGQFQPKLSITLIEGGCLDSTRKTPQNSGGVALPRNIRFEFDMVSTKGPSAPKDTIRADSVCAASGNSATICFKQTPIFSAQAGAGDFVWDFGDPADPNNKNLDSATWTPCHTYSGMGSFFPSITIKNICGPVPITYYYFTATGVGPTNRYLDTLHDYYNDIYDQTVSYDVSPNQPRPNALTFKTIPPPAGTLGFDGQVMPLNVLDSVPMKYQRTDTVSGRLFYVYKLIQPYKRYFGDSVYKIHDTTVVFRYDSFVPPPTFFVTPTQKLYSSIYDSLTLDTAGVIRTRDELGNIKDTLWYIFSRSYNYGVRVLGPVAKIEDPNRQITINPLLKNQCGPRDTVDFVNATPVPFKARNIWRQWDFDDDYAPRCTSFSVPHPGWPRISGIDSFARYEPVTNKLIVTYDTTRKWTDALEQYQHSDHYFIMNGITYPGKRNCRFSSDTLPRHHYPNWDTVYLWYRHGHDFMPWDTTRWTNDPTKVTPTRFLVMPWDTFWWGKPIFVNSGTGEWSLTPGSTYYTSTGTTVQWPRIDTMRANGTPTDRWPGNASQNGLQTTKVPDPWEMLNGNYYLINGAIIDTAVHHPPLTYTDKGRTVTLPPGLALLPDGKMTFFEYVFRRTVQRCLTVRLKLKDSLNNESADTGYPYTDPLDITRLDMWDCSGDASVQLALGRPDARGMGKKGKECPGFDKPGSPALVFNADNGYPGIQMNCGRTSIYLNIDSLADRLDGTPCYLDAFTTWGPTPTITPGGLVRTTWHSVINWPGIPPDPWTSPGGSIFQYHMGGNAPTPPPADTLLGLVTIGIYVGNGAKDTVLQVWGSNYKLNQTNGGGPLRDYQGRLINPQTGQPWTYQDIIIIDSVVNRATPPPTPIPPGWKDDSIAYQFAFNKILSKKPQIRYTTPTVVWDTLYEVEYLDPNFPNCLSDTVWYHNFWRIKDLNPNGYFSPSLVNTLLERNDTLMVVYQDSLQDSLSTTSWTWGDNTATIDSFYYAGADITDGYFVHGVRRVRYNVDYTNGLPGELIDSLEWPCGVYGQRQTQIPLRFYQRIFDSLSYIPQDRLLILTSKCSYPNHDPSGLYPDTIKLRAQDTVNLVPFLLPGTSYTRVLQQVGTIAPDTLLLLYKCPNPSHYDPQWHPYSNYVDTLFLPIEDTVRYTQFQTVDTSLMLLPVKHKYTKTSWEMAHKVPGSTITTVVGFIENTQKCQYTYSGEVTYGFIDTLSIFDASGAADTVFCRNESVYFVDSVRYFRFDNQITNVQTLNYGRSRGQIYGSQPYIAYQIDTIDFWRRDEHDPSDTLPNSGFMWQFRYFPGKWMHYDETGTYYPDTVGHWAPVLRGGDVEIVFPNSQSDPANLHPQPGKIIFYPGPGPSLVGFGNWAAPRGLYAWGFFGGWVGVDAPVSIDTLQSLNTQPSVIVNPKPGLTLIYNNGKGPVKEKGMYYWNGSGWTIVGYSPYVTFPYFTHRLYWDFGDNHTYTGIRPVHAYDDFGRFQITMVSRDSLGGFDTCLAYVQVMKPVAVPHIVTNPINCKDIEHFADSSYVLSGDGSRNSLDHVTSRTWWFTLHYAYPNGLAGLDTITPQAVIDTPAWFFSKKGVYKIKIAIETSQGCRDTADDTLYVEGPRPAFKLITDTIGCKPFRVGIWNLADSFDMRDPTDTPTRLTTFFWGDNTQSNVLGRRDTIWHTYADTGRYEIYASGSDDANGHPNCPVVRTPDNSANAGFEKLIYVYVKQPYKADIVSTRDTVCVDQSFDVNNFSDSLSYSKYRFERRFNDSALTFIDSTLRTNTAPLTTSFDSLGQYKIILFPTDYQNTVPLSARCAMQDTVTITVVKPTADFDIDTAQYPLYKFTNKSVGANYYDWIIYNKDGSERRKERVYPPIIDFSYDLGDDTGKFQVCLIAYTAIPNSTDPELCPDKKCKDINNIYTTKVVIPNVFTPDNNDGKNDVFKIDIEGDTKYDLTIFNRWGTKVFISDNRDKVWNGKNYNDGSECASGTYFFIFTYKLRGKPDEVTVHGTITLLREQ